MAKESMSPKKAAVKAASLLRGIDNSNAVINKHQGIIAGKSKELTSVLSGLTASSEAAAKPAPKAAKAAAPAKAAKPAPKAAAKPAPKAAKPKVEKAAKPVKAAKPAVAKPVKAAKPKVEKVAKPVKAAAPKAAKPAKAAKPPAKDRPPLRSVIREILLAAKGKEVSASDLYKEAISKHGTWSRQIMYNILKKDPSFVKGESGYKLAEVPAKVGSSSDEDVESFVDRVAGDKSVAATA